MKNYTQLLLTAVCVASDIDCYTDRQNKDNKIIVVWHVLKEYSVKWHKLEVGRRRFAGSCGRNPSVDWLVV
jgi:hypothetical protein